MDPFVLADGAAGGPDPWDLGKGGLPELLPLREEGPGT